MEDQLPAGVKIAPPPSEAPNGRADMSPRQYAALRQCSMATVYRRVKTGEITAYKLGGSTRITLDSVERETARNVIVPKMKS